MNKQQCWGYVLEENKYGEYNYNKRCHRLVDCNKRFCENHVDLLNNECNFVKFIKYKLKLFEYIIQKNKKINEIPNLFIFIYNNCDIFYTCDEFRKTVLLKIIIKN